MRRLGQYLKCIVTAFLLIAAAPALAQEEPEEIDALFEGLKTAEGEAAAQIEQRIFEIWSQSGSPAMDLLLERGREALEAGDIKRAVEHFSALIDHAPAFPEGYNARATAHFQNGRLGLSLDDIRSALALNPRHFGALSGLAFILEELGEPELALDAWREVERITPQREGLQDAIRRLERATLGDTL